MAQMERKRTDLPATVEPQADLENLPTLFSRLGDDVMRLVDTKLSLVKVELKEDASFYAGNRRYTPRHRRRRDGGAHRFRARERRRRVLHRERVRQQRGERGRAEVRADELRPRLPHHGRSVHGHRRHRRPRDEEEAGRLQPRAHQDPRRDQKGQAMAEERNLGLARAPEPAGDADSTKAELQRRMEEARESISQTVTEIKETVVNQYQQVRETISDTLDWREQYRRRPLPFTLGAFAVGALVGYSIMGAFKSDGYEDEDDFDEESAERAGRSYAAAPILGESHAPTAYQRAASPASAEENVEQYGRASESSGFVNRAASPASRPSYSSGYQASTAPQHAGAAAGGAEAEEEEA